MLGILQQLMNTHIDNLNLKLCGLTPQRVSIFMLIHKMNNIKRLRKIHNIWMLKMRIVILSHKSMK